LDRIFVQTGHRLSGVAAVFVQDFCPEPDIAYGRAPGFPAERRPVDNFWPEPDIAYIIPDITYGHPDIIYGHPDIAYFGSGHRLPSRALML